MGELTSLITKGTTPLDKSNIGTVNFVKIESIDNLSGEITITQKISSEEHEGYLRRSQLKENDILFSIAGTLGRVTSVKSSILPANTNQALAIIRLKSGCLKYVKTYLKGKAVADFIKKNPTIGAQPNLSLEQVSNIEIALPSEIEQAQIGSFFENLDHLITLHQRNSADFVSRFLSDFTNTWEQRKLSDIMTEGLSNGIMNNPGTNEFGTLHINVINMYTPDKIHIEDLESSACSSFDIQKCNVEVGDIFMTRSSLKPEGIAEANVLLENGSFVYDDHLIRMKVTAAYDPIFVKILLSTPLLKNQFIMKAKTTAFTTIGQNDIATSYGLFPPKEEQIKIGQFFIQLDNLITLHQCEYIFEK